VTTKQRASMVAIINSSSAVIELLRTLLESAGYETVTAHIDDIKNGGLDLLDFLKTHDPQVVIYDISIPYEENWTFLKLVRDTEAASGRRFVITTTNKQRLEQLVGPTDTLEIVGKPFDLDQVLAAVQRKPRHR
jgi:CheY-like chemotaxis protein